MKRMQTTKKEQARKILSNYSEEAIQHVDEALDEIFDVTCLEYDPEVDDFVEVSSDPYIKKIKTTYAIAGVDDGLFDSAKDFDIIYEALLELQK